MAAQRSYKPSNPYNVWLGSDAVETIYPEPKTKPKKKLKPKKKN